ncbi:membrane protein [Escherichia coli]|nr:membrane protein [Escherichia coli]
MLAGALFLTACSHNSSLPPFTASGFAEDQGAVRIWRKDSGDNVHLLAVFSPWRSGDTTTREYRWQGDNLTLININVYSKPPVNIRARFDDRGDLSFMQRESDGKSSSFLTTKSIYTVIVADQIRQISDALRQGRVVAAPGALACDGTDRDHLRRANH